MANSSSIFELSGNDLLAITTAIAVVLAQNCTAKELEVLSNVFGVLSDSLELYATQNSLGSINK